MLRPAEISANQEFATNYFGNAMAELDQHVALGEKFAKTALIVGLITGENVLLVGPPGGTKTNLASDMYRLVESLSLDNVAALPPHSATKDTQLVGGEQKQVKELVSQNGDVHTETIRAFVDAYIPKDTRLVWADEITRMDPRALNALLTLFENKELRTTAGVTHLEKLLMSVAGMNPSEKRHVTYPLAVAMVGRFGMGAMLGLRDKQDGEYLKHMETLAADEWVRTAQDVKPVIDVPGIMTLRSHVGQIKLPTDIARETAHTTDKLLDALEVDEHDAEEAWGRPVLRIARTVKGLGLLRRGGVATPEDVYDAVRYRATAILGGLSVHKSSRQIQSEIDGVVNGIFS